MSNCPCKAQSEAANPAASLPAKQPWPSKSGGGPLGWRCWQNRRGKLRFQWLTVSVQGEMRLYVYIYYIYICTRPCHPPSPNGMGPIYCLHMRSSPSLPVVWWGCGTVLGMYGVYGRFGMACLESMECLVCMVGMVCMA